MQIDPVLIAPFCTIIGVILGCGITAGATYFIQHGVEKRKQKDAKNERIRKAYADVAAAFGVVKARWHYLEHAKKTNLSMDKQIIITESMLEYRSTMLSLCNVVTVYDSSNERLLLLMARNGDLTIAGKEQESLSFFAEALIDIGYHIEHGVFHPKSTAHQYLKQLRERAASANQ